MSFLQKIFGSSNQRALKKMQVHVDQINLLEAEYQSMDDAELFALKDKLAKNYADDLSNLIPHAFAATREASVRTTGLRHFDSQMLGGIALADGNIAEMKTGEGKTLVATLPAYLNAVQGNKVVLVTVNDYLAQRDAEWMRPVYEFLGLSVGVIHSNQNFEEKVKEVNSLRTRYKRLLKDIQGSEKIKESIDEIKTKIEEDAESISAISEKADELKSKYELDETSITEKSNSISFRLSIRCFKSDSSSNPFNKF